MVTIDGAEEAQITRVIERAKRPAHKGDGLSEDSSVGLSVDFAWTVLQLFFDSQDFLHVRASLPVQPTIFKSRSI